MTNKEAIIILEGIRRDILPNDGVKRTEDVAFDLAIKALKFMDEHSDSILNETESEALLTYLRREENE
jgi:hypothetical protein